MEQKIQEQSVEQIKQQLNAIDDNNFDVSNILKKLNLYVQYINALVKDHNEKVTANIGQLSSINESGKAISQVVKLINAVMDLTNRVKAFINKKNSGDHNTLYMQRNRVFDKRYDTMSRVGNTNKEGTLKHTEYHLKNKLSSYNYNSADYNNIAETLKIVTSTIEMCNYINEYITPVTDEEQLSKNCNINKGDNTRSSGGIGNINKIKLDDATIDKNVDYSVYINNLQNDMQSLKNNAENNTRVQNKNKQQESQKIQSADSKRDLTLTIFNQTQQPPIDQTQIDTLQSTIQEQQVTIQKQNTTLQNLKNSCDNLDQTLKQWQGINEANYSTIKGLVQTFLLAQKARVESFADMKISNDEELKTLLNNITQQLNSLTSIDSETDINKKIDNLQQIVQQTNNNQQKITNDYEPNATKYITGLQEQIDNLKNQLDALTKAKNEKIEKILQNLGYDKKTGEDEYDRAKKKLENSKESDLDDISGITDQNAKAKLKQSLDDGNNKELDTKLLKELLDKLSLIEQIKKLESYVHDRVKSNKEESNFDHERYILIDHVTNRISKVYDSREDDKDRLNGIVNNINNNKQNNGININTEKKDLDKRLDDLTIINQIIDELLVIQTYSEMDAEALKGIIKGMLSQDQQQDKKTDTINGDKPKTLAEQTKENLTGDEDKSLLEAVLKNDTKNFDNDPIAEKEGLLRIIAAISIAWGKNAAEMKEMLLSIQKQLDKQKEKENEQLKQENEELEEEIRNAFGSQGQQTDAGDDQKDKDKQDITKLSENDVNGLPIEDKQKNLLKKILQHNKNQKQNQVGQNQQAQDPAEQNKNLVEENKQLKVIIGAINKAQHNKEKQQLQEQIQQLRAQVQQQNDGANNGTNNTDIQNRLQSLEQKLANFEKQEADKKKNLAGQIANEMGINNEEEKSKKITNLQNYDVEDLQKLLNLLNKLKELNEDTKKKKKENFRQQISNLVSDENKENKENKKNKKNKKIDEEVFKKLEGEVGAELEKKAKADKQAEIAKKVEETVKQKLEELELTKQIQDLQNQVTDLQNALTKLTGNQLAQAQGEQQNKQQPAQNEQLQVEQQNVGGQNEQKQNQQKNKKNKKKKETGGETLQQQLGDINQQLAQQLLQLQNANDQNKKSIIEKIEEIKTKLGNIGQNVNDLTTKKQTEDIKNNLKIDDLKIQNKKLLGEISELFNEIENNNIISENNNTGDNVNKLKKPDKTKITEQEIDKLDKLEDLQKQNEELEKNKAEMRVYIYNMYKNKINELANIIDKLTPLLKKSEKEKNNLIDNFLQMYNQLNKANTDDDKKENTDTQEITKENLEGLDEEQLQQLNKAIAGIQNINDENKQEELLKKIKKETLADDNTLNEILNEVNNENKKQLTALQEQVKTLQKQSTQLTQQLQQIQQDKQNTKGQNNANQQIQQLQQNIDKQIKQLNDKVTKMTQDQTQLQQRVVNNNKTQKNMQQLKNKIKQLEEKREQSEKKINKMQEQLNQMQQTQLRQATTGNAKQPTGGKKTYNNQFRQNFAQWTQRQQQSQQPSNQQHHFTNNNFKGQGQYTGGGYPQQQFYQQQPMFPVYPQQLYGVPTQYYQQQLPLATPAPTQVLPPQYSYQSPYPIYPQPFDMAQIEQVIKKAIYDTLQQNQINTQTLPELQHASEYGEHHDEPATYAGKNKKTKGERIDINELMQQIAEQNKKEQKQEIKQQQDVKQQQQPKELTYYDAAINYNEDLTFLLLEGLMGYNAKNIDEGGKYIFKSFNFNKKVGLTRESLSQNETDEKNKKLKADNKYKYASGVINKVIADVIGKKNLEAMVYSGVFDYNTYLQELTYNINNHIKVENEIARRTLLAEDAQKLKDIITAGMFYTGFTKFDDIYAQQQMQMMLNKVVKSKDFKNVPYRDQMKYMRKCINVMKYNKDLLGERTKTLGELEQTFNRSDVTKFKGANNIENLLDNPDFTDTIDTFIGNSQQNQIS